MAFEILLKPTVIVPCVLFLFYVTYRAFTVKSEVSALPVINVEEGKWFARARATWKTTFQYRAAIDYAYEAVSTGRSMGKHAADKLSPVLQERPGLHHT